jgi:hypothetical protein
VAVAREGLASVDQADFSAGAHPGLEVIPSNGAEDIVNGILSDDGSVFGRGGSSYLGTLAASSSRPFRNLWSGYLGAVGAVTVASKSQGTTIVSEGVSAILPGATDFAGMFTTDSPPQRPVVYQGMLVLVVPAIAGAGVSLNVWGGATGAGATGQGVTFTIFSKTVTGAGTSWLSTVTPGMIMHGGTMNDRVAVVESVQSNTSLTLFSAWQTSLPGATVDITPSHSLTVAEEALPVSSAQVYAAVVADRLVLARGPRVAFTSAIDPFDFQPTDYHELPSGARVVGLEPLRDQLMVFSTDGVYAVSGMGYDLTDAAGNPQQRMEHVAPNLVLWDNRGIAGWRNSIVVPCVDDVYLFDGVAGSRPITGGMRRLYRSYVRRGFQTGQAAAFDSRYLLPIVSGNDWIDTLICDLRTGAWTRWDGIGAASSAFATRPGEDVRQPRLYGLGAQGATRRVHDLSTVLDPEDADVSDADGSQVDLKVTTRTLSVPRSEVAQTWRKFRARLELQGTPTVTLERSEGKPGGVFVTISNPRVRTDDAESIYRWAFTERSRAIRFRVTVDGSADRAVLRAFDASFRQSGKP